MLSAIVQKVTGQTVLDYLRPAPVRAARHRATRRGTRARRAISLGGFGLSVTTEDIARFGQLYLQKGAWQGRQLAARRVGRGGHRAADLERQQPEERLGPGYGYQFWRCRHGAYRGDGAFGQYCIVMPEQDAVVAITSGVRDMQAVLNLVWDQLLPAMRPGRSARRRAGAASAQAEAREPRRSRRRPGGPASPVAA